MKTQCLIYLWLIISTGNVYAQNHTITTGTTIPSQNNQYRMHIEFPVTSQCTLYVLLDSRLDNFWFIDLSSRSTRKASSPHIEDIILNQVTLLSTMGVVIPVASFFRNFSSFQYLDIKTYTHKNKSLKKIMGFYTDTSNRDNKSHIRLQHIYNTYTQNSTTFTYDSNTRLCIDD